jgi:transposase InsO family protein
MRGGGRQAPYGSGTPWENGYIESFNARLRDELLNGEVFYSIAEARIIIESWRRFYNTLAAVFSAWQVSPQLDCGPQRTGPHGEIVE